MLVLTTSNSRAPGPLPWRRVVKEIGKNEYAEKTCFRNDESNYAGIVFLRPERIERSTYGDDWIRTIGFA